jgi:hypothetical protein
VNKHTCIQLKALTPPHKYTRRSHQNQVKTRKPTYKRTRKHTQTFTFSFHQLMPTPTLSLHIAHIIHHPPHQSSTPQLATGGMNTQLVGVGCVVINSKAGFRLARNERMRFASTLLLFWICRLLSWEFEYGCWRWGLMDLFGM